MTPDTPILRGLHESRDDGVCAMELVAWMAGEAHSDHPACACPVVSALIRAWNDDLPSDEDRDRLLRPLLASAVGSKSSRDVEERRSWMALDWLVRVHAVAWLRLAGLAEHADALAGLAEIRDRESGTAAQPALDAARDAARYAAREIAWAAAGYAAWDAARAAAGYAARAALAPTVATLQSSAQSLVMRMLAVKP